MRMSVLGYHGLFSALYQLSATRFSFGFISKAKSIRKVMQMNKMNAKAKWTKYKKVKKLKEK